MTKKITRPVSLLLTILMLAGVFTAVPFTAFADTEPVLKTGLVYNGEAQELIEASADGTVEYGTGNERTIYQENHAGNNAIQNNSLNVGDVFWLTKNNKANCDMFFESYYNSGNGEFNKPIIFHNTNGDTSEINRLRFLVNGTKKYITLYDIDNPVLRVSLSSTSANSLIVTAVDDTSVSVELYKYTNGSLSRYVINDWTTDLPTATDAGSYDVYSKPAGSVNENDFALLGTVNIAKVTPTANVTAADLPYNGQEQELIASASTDFGTLEYGLTRVPVVYGNGEVNSSELKVGDIIYPHDGGTVTFTGDSAVKCSSETVLSINHNAAFSRLELKISNSSTTLFSKNSMVVTSVEDGVVYIDGNDYDPNGTPASVVEKWSESIPKATAVGEYPMAYRVVGNKNINDIPQTNLTANIVDSYTVTWKNGETVLEEDTFVASGSTPTYNGEAPTKDEDESNTYTFSGWSNGETTYAPNELPAVTGDVTYTATFSSTPKSTTRYVLTDTLEDGGEYLIVGYIRTSAWAYWKNTISNNASGVTVVSGTPDYIEDDTNIKPECIWTAETNENGFSLRNSNKYLKAGTGTMAATSSTVGKQYWNYSDSHLVYYNPTSGKTFYAYLENTGTFKTATNSTNGTVYLFKKVVNEEPTTVEPTTVEPTTEEPTTEEPTTEEPTTVEPTTEEPTTEEPTTEEPTTEPTYTVTWVDYDETVLEVDENVPAGATPSYDGTLPTYYIKNEKLYKFDGWSPNPSEVTGNTTYKAQYVNAGLYLYVNNTTVDPAETFVVYDIEPSDSIATLKAKIAEKCDISAPRQKLVYNSKTLSDEKSIADCNLNKGCTVTLSAKKLISGESLSLEGDIHINFYINPAAAGLTSENIGSGKQLTVTFEWAKDFGNEKDKPKTNITQYNITETVDSNNVGGEIMVSCPVCAAEMSCQVRATATLNGVTDTKDYSARDYANSVINKDKKTFADMSVNNPVKYNELVDLVKAMLDYGAKAQKVFGINTSDLANNGLNYTMGDVTDKMLETAVKNANNGATASNMKEVAESLGANYYTSSLIFLSQSTLRHYFTKKDSTFDSSLFGDNNQNNTYYYVEKTNIPAAELDKLQKFTVGSTTFYYSAFDYARALLKSSGATEDMKDLAKSLYWYNRAANYFFCEHTTDTRETNRVEPDSCTVDGSYDLETYCTKCGNVLETEHRIIEAPGHMTETARYNETAATCTVEGGYDLVTYCTVCETILSSNHFTIPAPGHTTVTRRENETAATCTVEGGYDLVTYCTVCETVLGSDHFTIPANGHTTATRRENETLATCTANGGYDLVTYCTVCETVLGSNHVNIPANGHTTATRHENETAATCSADGSYDLVTYCTVCETVLGSTHHTIPATGQHTIVYVAEVPATADSDGVQAHYACSKCGAKFKDAQGNTPLTEENLAIKNINALSDESYIVQDGAILTGTLNGNHKITIADGATVTLKNLNITSLSNNESASFAGITALGDATLVLEGTNIVKGGYDEYPGVFVPEGKTLTIEGTGSLDASSNGWACGIGAGYQHNRNCGNIIINSGTITAKGGNGAAGIGSGHSTTCGTITINGGNITASGTGQAAGIGTGTSGRCGNITINGGTVKVTDGDKEIGAAYYGVCGDIYIKNTVTLVNATRGAAGFGTCGNVYIENGANVFPLVEDGEIIVN